MAKRGDMKQGQGNRMEHVIFYIIYVIIRGIWWKLQ